MSYQLEELQAKVDELQNDFYNTNPKNYIFKGSQKNKCATEITNAIGIHELLKHTVYAIPNTNKVFFDYTVFKQYAIPELFLEITEYTISVIRNCVSSYGKYEIHVNLQSFTISSCQKYKDIISLFCNKCMRCENKYAQYLETMYIYNSPSMMDTISSILRTFMDDCMKHKIVLYEKKISADLLHKLIGHY
jgi:hypothetical protein